MNLKNTVKMDLTIDNLINELSLLAINEEKIKKIIKIQKWFRGCILRLKRLPPILYYIQRYLKSSNIKLSNITTDGRNNSTTDENIVKELLFSKFGKRIKDAPNRHWYDILVFDNLYGWIPVNIKSSTTKNSDNTGNITMCVYAYTNYNIDIHRQQTYKSGDMEKKFSMKLKLKEYNYEHKRDYYFVVVNKLNTKDIIINSVKGLTKLTPNANNLPFQVRWNKNREFIYNRSIENIVKYFAIT